MKPKADPSQFWARLKRHPTQAPSSHMILHIPSSGTADSQITSHGMPMYPVLRSVPRRAGEVMLLS